MFSFRLILMFFLINSAFFSCKKEPKSVKKTEIKIDTVKIQSKIETQTKSKKELEKKAKASWDTLHYNNVASFFTAYGKQNKENKVLIKTKFGNIKVRLFNDTPIHRANFIFLVKTGYFNTTVFHRVAKEMVIQGGESDGEESAAIRNKYRNYKLPSEASKRHKHKYGALALAKNEEYNPDNLSNPFNFYIVNTKQGAHHLDGLYTVFGEVISGYSTVRKISNVKVGYGEWPIDDVHIKMEVIK